MNFSFAADVAGGSIGSGRATANLKVNEKYNMSKTLQNFPQMTPTTKTAVSMLSYPLKPENNIR